MSERMGDFLVRTGAMSQQQLDDVIKRQKAGDTRAFGEIAISLAYIPDSGPVDTFLEFQKKQLGA